MLDSGNSGCLSVFAIDFKIFVIFQGSGTVKKTNQSIAFLLDCNRDVTEHKLLLDNNIH